MRRRFNAVDLRERYAAHLEEMAASYAAIPGCPWGPLAERVRAGETVEVSGWEVNDWTPGVVHDHRYLLDADGTLREIA